MLRGLSSRGCRCCDAIDDIVQCLVILVADRLTVSIQRCRECATALRKGEVPRFCRHRRISAQYEHRQRRITNPALGFPPAPSTGKSAARSQYWSATDCTLVDVVFIGAFTTVEARSCEITRILPNARSADKCLQVALGAGIERRYPWRQRHGVSNRARP